MKEWWTEFWNTKAGAARTLKFALMIFAGLLQTGALPVPEGWSGALLPWLAAALGVGIPAGENNAKAA